MDIHHHQAQAAPWFWWNSVVDGRCSYLLPIDQPCRLDKSHQSAVHLLFNLKERLLWLCIWWESFLCVGKPRIAMWIGKSMIKHWEFGYPQFSIDGLSILNHPEERGISRPRRQATTIDVLWGECRAVLRMPLGQNVVDGHQILPLKFQDHANS